MKQPATKAAETKTSPASPWNKFIAASIFIAAALLLFVRLDHYALWDDEAGTALNAVAIWRTGDTTAIIDHNIVAYQNGKDLTNLKERFMPPLPAYLTAPFIGLLGQKAWVARLPFALCGLFCVVLILYWVRKTNPTTLIWIAVGIALLCNVSFFLFFKNCRYYGIAIVATTALLYLYWNWENRPRNLILFVVISICLFASNYLNYAALYGCLAIDYVIWSRKRIRLSLPQWTGLLIPQVIVCSLIFWIWNPLAKASTTPVAEDPVSKMTLFGWYWRDSVLEFSNPVLMIVALIVCLLQLKKNSILLRLFLFLLAYIVVITTAAPAPPTGNEHIEVRYLAAVVSVFIAIGILTIQFLARRAPPIIIPLAVLAFAVQWHRVGYGPARVQVTIADYVRELINPPGDPYTVAAKWIDEHLEAKQSIWVWPGYMAYPLMFDVPKPIYAWQLTSPPKEEQFKKLDRIHFQNQIAPDYILVFGPEIEMILERFVARPRRGFEYRPVTSLDFYWDPMHRPEFLRRTFTPMTNYDKNTEAVYILQRTN